ncbi:hypothetical protein [Xenorhabdus mauleonii]|uniref:hypothetical protein n=1 Tax=Xenorhabdus mauleonii TaxID=351675 RepID=UPI001113D82F|nr:hypothetical protein [Xenorhabdus mauleonii]
MINVSNYCPIIRHSTSLAEASSEKSDNTCNDLVRLALSTLTPPGSEIRINLRDLTVNNKVTIITSPNNHTDVNNFVIVSVVSP